ncbi:MAG: ParB/RepB/Spo0J family partition protein [Desulfobacteraceae bacterium]|nr:ParB/RepB/Spo0J family partition protein [Desulfobacteraceae bacterium]MBC2752573.1 ParB/RepB/Spo0J family partition protein [Desulfobacteraceae bacterium]
MKNFTSIQTTANELNNNPQVIDIPMENLSVPLSHPRRSQGDQESLQKSIRKNGLLEPLTVCKSDVDDSYMVIDGTRRLTIIAEFGWKAVQCVVLDSMPLGEIAHYSFERNMERKSLNAIEVALHIKSMRDKYGYSLRDLETLGYGSPALISQKIRLLELPESVQTKIEDGVLTTAHGVALSKLGNTKHIERMAKRALDFGWTAKRLDTTIDKFVQKGKTPAIERIEFPEGDIPGVYFKDAKDMGELPDKSVHLIVTSPPFCIGMEFEKGISYAEHWENMQEVMAEASRVLVPGGIMAMVVGDIHNFKGAKGNNKYSQIQLVGHKYQSFLRKHQVYLSDLIVWTVWTHAQSMDISKFLSDNTPHTGYRILIGHAPVYIFRKKGERDTPPDEIVLNSRITKEELSQWASGIWAIKPASQKEGHPAVLPDELVARLVRMFSYEGDMVLDPFLGSGTTVKVARELNREAIGYERERQYKSVIAKKLGVDLGTKAKSMIEYVSQSILAEVPEQASAPGVAEPASETSSSYETVFESGPAC